jgi:phage terminase small subunit
MEKIKCPRPGCEGYLTKPKQKQLGKTNPRARKTDEYGLVPKQNAFVREYIKDYCGAQAAIRAGYSKKAAKEIASELLTKPHIQAGVTREERKLQNRFILTKERVLKELALIGYSDLSEYVTTDNEGRVTINEMATLPPQISRALKSIKSKTDTLVQKVDGGTFRELEKAQIEVVLHDKIQALNLMGKEIGLFKDKCEISGKDGGPIKIQEVDDEELLRIITGRGSAGTAEAKKGTSKPG